MGLPSSSVTPFFISMYKDSKTLLMLLMKSSNFSTVALPGNKQAKEKKRRVLHQKCSLFQPAINQNTKQQSHNCAKARALLGECRCLWLLPSWSVQTDGAVRRKACQGLPVLAGSPWPPPPQPPTRVPGYPVTIPTGHLGAVGITTRLLCRASVPARLTQVSCPPLSFRLPFDIQEHTEH